MVNVITETLHDQPESEDNKGCKIGGDFHQNTLGNEDDGCFLFCSRCQMAFNPMKAITGPGLSWVLGKISMIKNKTDGCIMGKYQSKVLNNYVRKAV